MRHQVEQERVTIADDEPHDAAVCWEAMCGERPGIVPYQRHWADRPAFYRWLKQPWLTPRPRP